jgi:phosphoenolpyruvate-protein phosphotransferase (PTS system enzyme I)
MIEIPSAALVADALAQAREIFQHRQQRPDPIHPRRRPHERKGFAPLRADASGHPAPHQDDRGRRARNGIWAGVCGEIAGDPVLAPLLIGLGVDELSAAPPVIDEVKYIIRRLKLTEAQALAEFALQCESPSEIFARCPKL